MIKRITILGGRLICLGICFFLLSVVQAQAQAACPPAPTNLRNTNPPNSNWKLWWTNVFPGPGEAEEESFSMDISLLPNQQTYGGFCAPFSRTYPTFPNLWGLREIGIAPDRVYYNCSVTEKVCANKTGCSPNCAPSLNYYVGVNICAKADINRDNTVDILDYSRLSSCYGSNCSDRNTCPDNWYGQCQSADINEDNKVTMGDYSLLSSCFWEDLCWCSQEQRYQTKVFGHVYERTTGQGINNSQITLVKKSQPTDPYTEFGSINTQGGGSWEFNLPEKGPYELVVFKKNNPPCSEDPLPAFPQTPAYDNWYDPAANAVHTRYNSASVGPIDFYVQCGNISPTPAPPANCTDYCPFPEPALALQGKINLDNVYGNSDKYGNTDYSIFTASSNSEVDKIKIKWGNWGGAGRAIVCKVTDTSNKNISSEVSSENATSAVGSHWSFLDFSPNPFSLSSGQQYRLYCRNSVADSQVYWVYNNTAPPDQNKKLYCLHTCPEN